MVAPDLEQVAKDRQAARAGQVGMAPQGLRRRRGRVNGRCVHAGDCQRDRATTRPRTSSPRPARSGRPQPPGPQFQTDVELAQLAGDIGTTIFHPVGTAKMGVASDAMAVVDARMRVHGVQALRVVDASVMPTITSGNTNSPTLMIAERAAGWILADATP